jgi:hypothetical protein
MEVLSMAKRKSDSPQKAALREMMSTYMKENNVLPKNGTDVNSIMRDMMSIILEGTLDAEMDEELGYSKYDYKNKDTDNRRNGYSQKIMNGVLYKSIEKDVSPASNLLSRDGLCYSLNYISADERAEKVMENQSVIRQPIVRNGRQATVGYAPDVWKTWQ